MALLASSDETTMAELSPSIVGEDIAAVEVAAAANPNPPTTQLDPNITKLVQTWHASQKAELQGKYETQQLRREMKTAKKEIIKEMKRKKVTAIQLGENSYLLLFVTGHESVVKPELLASELASVTVAECEAASEIISSLDFKKPSAFCRSIWRGCKGTSWRAQSKTSATGPSALSRLRSALVIRASIS